MQAGDRALAAAAHDLVPPPRRRLAWMAAVWLIAIVALSAIASVRPYLLLQWTQYLPGRDKTGHFLLMGGFAGVSVLAFAGRRIATRRVSALAVLASVALIVVARGGRPALAAPPHVLRRRSRVEPRGRRVLRRARSDLARARQTRSDSRALGSLHDPVQRYTSNVRRPSDDAGPCATIVSPPISAASLRARLSSSESIFF